MKRHLPDWHSIKTRATLFTLAMFLLSTLTLAFYGRGILRDTVQKLLGEQQFATASIIAANVNHELIHRQQALAALARSLPPLGPAAVDDEAKVQARLEQRPGWQDLFNAGTFIVRTNARAPSSGPAGARDWSFIADALREGKATLGETPANEPRTASLIGMATPLYDRQGRVIAALVGLADLTRSVFLDQFADRAYDWTGGYLLVSGTRRVVGGRDRTGLMETLPAAAGDPLVDRLLEGQEGSAVAVTARGMAVLVSAKGIPVAGWHALVTLPVEEAFSPFHAARRQMLLATIVLALLASALIWFFLRREFAPMLAAVKALATQTQSDRLPQPLSITRQDEIAELIGGFNQMLFTLAQREEALMAAKAELRIAATAFDSHESMLVTDAHGVILRVNKAFTESTGYSAEEAVGQTPKLLKSGRHDDDFFRRMWDTLNRTGSWQGEIWDRRKNGEIYPKWLTISALKDSQGAVTHYVGAHFDITERKQSEERVQRLAFSDPLTSLPNRRLFIARLQQAMAAGRRTNHHGAVMFLDLDNFKPLNDSHGHLAGDLLLVEAARRLKGCVRSVDTVARFGGDEFVVLLTDLYAGKQESAAHTALVAEKIRLALSEPYRLNISQQGKADALLEHRCTASIGVMLLINDDASPDDLLKCADQAMYQAKAAGRNQIRFYEPPQTIAPGFPDEPQNGTPNRFKTTP